MKTRGQAERIQIDCKLSRLQEVQNTAEIQTTASQEPTEHARSITARWREQKAIGLLPEAVFTEMAGHVGSP
jgi:hypothetical protein